MEIPQGKENQYVYEYKFYTVVNDFLQYLQYVERLGETNFYEKKWSQAIELTKQPWHL